MQMNKKNPASNTAMTSSDYSPNNNRQRYTRIPEAQAMRQNMTKSRNEEKEQEREQRCHAI